MLVVLCTVERSLASSRICSSKITLYSVECRTAGLRGSRSQASRRCRESASRLLRIRPSTAATCLRRTSIRTRCLFIDFFKLSNHGSAAAVRAGCSATEGEWLPAAVAAGFCCVSLLISCFRRRCTLRMDLQRRSRFHRHPRLRPRHLSPRHPRHFVHMAVSHKVCIMPSSRHSFSRVSWCCACVCALCRPPAFVSDAVKLSCSPVEHFTSSVASTAASPEGWLPF